MIRVLSVMGLYLSHALPVDLFRPYARSPKGHEESRLLWPLLVAHLFTWDDKYFDQPLPQHAIGWEGLSALSHFVLECTPASRRNTVLGISSLFFIGADRADPTPGKDERQDLDSNIFFFHG